MSEHEHEWKLSYILKNKTGIITKYYCKACGEFTEKKGAEQTKRASGMGGKFSTNWNG
jgi:hypothetical protein